MLELTADRFQEFFRELWSKPGKEPTIPFQWQHRLAKRVLTADKPWPDAIALPTAAGKTACLDIAVYALASQAERLDAGKTLTAVRRIFFVVDRRVIVDEAYARARAISTKLRDAKEGVLKEVADRLRLLARGERAGAESENPLAVFELRGGMYRSEAWARSPLQPIIVASTVDQLGSRLLFRAYGRGPGMWPIYAGLVANDSLILLDEAHCAQPFLQTLQAIARYRGWAEAPLPTRFYPVVMSATPPAGLEDVFRDESRESTDPTHPLGKRQLARKPAVLRVVEKAHGKNAIRALAEALVEVAEDMTKEAAKAVVIFVNRVATARETFRLLTVKYGESAVLLTGRMRPIDKDDTILQRLQLLSAENSEERNLKQPIFVVATQTLEVGANLDFDALVTECASLDALRQRFGRLNRKGRPIEAHAAILIRADHAENSDEDPVYGSSLAKTWAWLSEQTKASGVVDFGINTLESLLPENEVLAEFNAPTVNAPVMLPAHVDCWAQTQPEPDPTPDVALFLRGPKRGAADVQVCWRADINLTTFVTEEDSIDAITLCPPSSSECLSVPIGVFRRWMAGEKLADDSSDVEGAVSEIETQTEEGEKAYRVVRWRGRKEVEAVEDPSAIRPGDVVVIPADTQGWHQLGDLPHALGTQPVLDWGDRAHSQTRAKALLRLTPAVISQWPECVAKSRILELANEAFTRYEEDPATLTEELHETLVSLANDVSVPTWLREIASTIIADRRFRYGIKLHPLSGIVVQSKRRLKQKSDDTDYFSDENDGDSSGTVRIPLLDHLPGVAAYARRFAVGCGMPQPLADIVELAGLLHDLGKADQRFQCLLRNGTPWVSGELLAKSNDIPEGRAAYNRALKLSGYPESGRHELLSVRFLEGVSTLTPEDKSSRELILHLIASSHGYCRPFAPVVFDNKPVEVKLKFNGQLLSHSSDTSMELLDSGVSDRFWRLTRRYGWWGLAWLEAILRLADHRRSEAEALQAEDKNSEQS